MSRGPGRTQRAIAEQLSAARTVEPWPVWMTASGLARIVYGTATPSPGQLETVRRACRTSATLEQGSVWTRVAAPTRWEPERTVQRSVLMARMPATPAEDWLWRAWNSHTATSNYSWRLLIPAADQDGYQVPDPQRLAAAVEAAAPKELPPDGVLQLVNGFCGSGLGKDDVERWTEARRRAELAEAERREHNRAARAARSQSQMRVGPFLVDIGKAPEVCPCCRQSILDPDSWEIAVFQALSTGSGG